MTAPDPTTAEARAAIHKFEAETFRVLDHDGSLVGYYVTADEWRVFRGRILAARLAPASGLAAGIEAEIAHAEANGHVLDPGCQGTGGEWVPAVRVDYLRALLAAHPAPEVRCANCGGKPGDPVVCAWCPDPVPVPEWQAVAAPQCESHREVQHRDRKPPWCDRCGWTHGRPASPPRKVGDPR